MTKTPDTRKNQRFEVELPIEFKETEAWTSATTRNLSMGGAYISHESQPAFGKRLQIRFRIPAQADWIEVGGIVRWTARDGFGVQFDGLRARDVWALGKHFESA